MSAILIVQIIAIPPFGIIANAGNNNTPVIEYLGEPIYEGMTIPETAHLSKLTRDLTSLSIDSPPILEPTDYWLVETGMIDGYTSDSDSIKIPLTGRTGDKTVNAANDSAMGSLTFTKYSDKDGGTVLPGATFTLTNQTDTDYVLTATSGDYGVVEFEDVPSGTYLLEETGPPFLHEPVDPLDVIIDTAGNLLKFGDQDVNGELTLTNEMTHRYVQITKRDAKGDPLADVQFKLKRKIGDDWVSVTEPVTGSDGVTSSEGVVTFQGIYRNAKYQITEVTPEGYYASDSHIFTITDDSGIDLTWVNHPCEGVIKITQKDELRDILLDGVRFDLYASASTNAQLIATAVSGQMKSLKLCPFRIASWAFHW